MIKIEVTRVDGMITKVIVSGHAEYAPHGQDLVCAGCSAIVFGALNALDELWNEVNTTVTIEENKIEIVNDNDLDISYVLEVMYIQLKTLQSNYKDYISIQEQEV